MSSGARRPRGGARGLPRRRALCLSRQHVTPAAECPGKGEPRKWCGTQEVRVLDSALPNRERWLHLSNLQLSLEGLFIPQKLEDALLPYSPQSDRSRLLAQQWWCQRTSSCVDRFNFVLTKRLMGEAGVSQLWAAPGRPGLTFSPFSAPTSCRTVKHNWLALLFKRIQIEELGFLVG